MIPQTNDPVSIDVGQVLHFNDKSRIIQLENEIAQLKAEVTRLQQESNCRGSFIRSVAQEYFSQDPNSVYLAGLSYNRPVTREEVVKHWTENGGPEAFAEQFPTAERVMKYFVRLHRLSKKRIHLTHPIAG